ncbi:MAG: DUF6503 family protein [Bacteroidota bacterium]
MKKLSLLSAAFLFLLLPTACKTGSEATAPQQNFPQLFKQVLTAHGSLSQWRKMKTLKFTRGTGEDAVYHLINLATRDEVMTKDGSYTLGFQGKSMWVAPNKEAFPGKSPRFYRNLHFYFFALPFVLADPGVNLSDEGEKTTGGQRYRILKATFNAGVGDAPEDQYILYIDPATYRIAMINYSVTYFDNSKATQYNALVYDWQEVDGLLVPSSFIGYKWEDNALGDKRYEAPFSKVAFDKAAIPASAFAPTPGAFVEAGE